MQTRFTKEGIQHFFIVNWDDEWIDNYENSLLRYQKIPHFMSYEVRSIDDKTELYYKLDYHTSLKTAIIQLQFDISMLENMISSIVDAIKECQEYLLDPDNIVFDIDMVFVDIGTGKLLFVYYPGFIGDNRTPKHLISQMLNNVNRKNEECMVYLMNIYDMLSEQDFSFNNIPYYHNTLENPVSKSFIDENSKDDSNDKKRGIAWFIKILLMIVSVFDITLLAGLIFEVLTYEKMGYLFVGMAILIGLTIIYMVIDEEETPEMIMDEYNKREIIDNNNLNDIKNEELYYKKLNESQETVILTVDEEDESVVISELFHGELFLEAMVKDMFPSIYINGGNVVVGSLKDACDYVLAARGVSRFHAKLLKKEDGLYLLDLNSTNGTYLNGNQLEAGREYRLEVGDMVSFAGNGFFVAEDTAYISGRKAG